MLMSSCPIAWRHPLYFTPPFHAVHKSIRGTKPTSPPHFPSSTLKPALLLLFLCISSFFLGFFALGPYLAFRRENVVPSMPQPKWLISVLESRLPAFLAVFGAVSCLYLATLGGAPLDMGKALDNETLD